MDCRRTLGLGLCLLIGAAGCTRQEAAVPVVPPAQASRAGTAPPPVVNVPPGAVVKKASDLPKRPPSAATCVAFGDFAAQEAEAPDLADAARKEKQEQARKAYEQAVTLDAKCQPAYLALAHLYVAMKDHDHAEATYAKACKLFPADAKVFFEAGRCYGGEKKWDEAIKALSRAVELEPENRPYVDTLGWMQARAGRFDASFATFRKVYDEPEAHYKLALMLDHMNQSDLCRKHLQAALDKGPSAGMEGAKALLAKLDGQAAGPVQQASYKEPVPAPATPPPPPVAPPPPPGPPVVTPVAAVPSGPTIPPPAADLPRELPPAVVSADKPLVLPPPPRIPIRYQDGPQLPPPGPNG